MYTLDDVNLLQIIMIIINNTNYTNSRNVR